MNLIPEDLIHALCLITAKTDILFIKWSIFHGWAEDRLKRPIYTLEFGAPLDFNITEREQIWAVRTIGKYLNLGMPEPESISFIMQDGESNGN